MCYITALTKQEMNMIYAGIGNRNDVPERYITIMREIGSQAAKEGFTLRSGGATGSDRAFEQGCKQANGKMEIYLPWRYYNNNKSDLYHIPNEAFEVASEYYPRWGSLKEGVKKLFARNVQIVLGANLDKPVKMVICFVADECTSFGTKHAIRVANDNGIPVYNLNNYPYDRVINSLFK
jgi:hypothetical protein